MGGDLEDFRRFLLSRYDEELAKRVVNLVNHILEVGSLDLAEEQTASQHMRRKLRYAWRKYEEYRRYLGTYGDSPRNSQGWLTWRS